MSLYLGKIPIIKRSLNEGWLSGVGDESFGCIPRDFDADPPLMGDSPDGIHLISDADCEAYYQEQQATQSSLTHRFLDGPNGGPVFVNLDQNGQGFCWAYSTAHALMLNRLKSNLPVVRLSGHAVACKIKNFHDQGGWCGESAKFARGSDPRFPNLAGYPSTDFWPEDSMNRKYDTQATWDNALLHKSEEDWYDLGKREYDQTLSKRQIKTLGLTNCPMMLDFNRFSHSMCGITTVMFEPGAWGPMVLNSWKGWGYHGLAVLAEMWPDNACAIRSITASGA